MSATTRRRGPNPHTPEIALLVVLFVALLVLLPFYDPLLGLVAGAIAAVAAGLAGLWVLRRRRVPAVDRAAAHLPGPALLRRSSRAGAAAEAVRLGARVPSAPGVFIGRTVRGDRELWGSWEDMHLDIWGPRSGKTSSRAIPGIVGAPGSVVVTSNKRDIVDATRGVRERRGPVWVFDPQQLAGEPPSWWWNPLSFIGDNIAKAVMLGSFFSGINRGPHMRTDGYFEPAAQSLLGAYLLAAALDDLPITRVVTWLHRPNDGTALRILRDAGPKHTLAADGVAALHGAPARQRAGVFGAAAQMVAFLASPEVIRWVTPGDGPRRPEFRHDDFASRDDATLYLLSQETDRTAAPLVLAFASAIAYAQEGRAIESPGGRLPVPALYVLDEAANVCPWLELPFLYSHYGSRGIVIMTILQSWAQGVSVWGEAGMAQMWDAANVRVHGGGSADIALTGALSAVTPSFEPRVTSVSFSARSVFGRTVGLSSRPEPVLDVADLANLPRGRAFVQVSGHAPTLVRTVPWWHGPYAEAVRESLARYGPRATAS
ncbi:TraM recognition domain-containing protein [Yinghuangia sp. ASG 101]|uniref:type IV secretory system conjugative DNA transfer family protein n=1 Tax=Yinghuangia sp. ASG 101 TaxID=2896848 RepID=UPI001E53A9D0|nr:type IV secretory system conjugative DNA transfer family protein [Yinghuangia sp. ASG 101]UGQ13158.1 TraM recognition domain-containing protein [Yinghuangia sp. ASG 101]